MDFFDPENFSASRLGSLPAFLSARLKPEGFYGLKRRDEGSGEQPERFDNNSNNTGTQIQLFWPKDCHIPGMAYQIFKDS